MDYDSYIESLNSGRNAEFVNEWFTDDCMVDGGGAPIHGRVQFIAFLDMIRDGVREIARPQRMGYGENVIFAELDVDFVCSKNRPDFPMGPLRAGETMTLRCHVVYTVRDGRVAVMHNMSWRPGYGVTKAGAPAMRNGSQSDKHRTVCHDVFKALDRGQSVMDYENSPGSRFRAEASQEALTDLRERLERTRLPKDQAGPDWKTGTPISYAARLRDYWLHEFDWRRWETRINAFEQRMIEIDGQQLHVLVERGSGKNPLPLILSHGWPGSFIEFMDIIGPLAHPERHGGSVEEAFTVVVPSLPGYGFSPAPTMPLSPNDIGRLWSKLMTEAFGFDRYVAYGSDWGSLITALMAFNHPEKLLAFLITSPGGVPTVTASDPFTDEEKLWLERSQAQMAPESAYQSVQATKPQSLAYGHVDSPIALACWIIEKFQGWTVPGSAADPPFSMDELLANVMLYWLNGATAPMWLYMFLGNSTQIAPGQRTSVPGGFLFAPNDLFPPAPRHWLERSFNVSHYSVAEKGGHFPGMDNAELLIAELRKFLGKWR